jgi:hypothetical protein
MIDEIIVATRQQRGCQQGNLVAHLIGSFHLEHSSNALLKK